MFKKTLIATLLASAMFISTAQAGPFILAGTDADDHGSASGGANNLGWLFMQRALEKLASLSALTNGNLNVVNLGSSGRAQSAATSAFNLSSLAGGGGFSFTIIDGVAGITDFFAGNGAVNINNVGIIMMDSGSNVTGGSSTTNAAVIDNLLGAGGGLFSQSNGYGWVSSLLPNLTIVGGGGSGANLTAAGNAAFPGLTNADLTGGPSAVPVPATLALMGLGLVGFAAVSRRRSQAK